MSVYVGMDVHRKRSQVAVVDDAGTERRNRNVPNDPAELVPILGALPPGTPVAFEAAYGWGWLVDLLDELELEPHPVHPSRCKAIASARLQERQGRRAHLGPAAARRPATRGLDRSPAGPRPARPAGASGMAWPRGHRGQGSRARGAGRPRRPGRAAAVDDCGASLAGRPGPASRLACRHRRLRGAHRSAQPVGGPARAGPARPRRPRPLSRRAAGAARHRADHRHDAGRRDR
jgi:hypothetical protein